MPFTRSAIADLLQALRMEQTEKVNAIAALVQKWLGFPFFCVICYFEYRALKDYTTPGEPVIAYRPFPAPTLAGYCLLEYTALHSTLILSIVYFVISIFTQLLTLTKPCGGILVCLVGATESVVALLVTYFAIAGIYITSIASTAADVEKCEDLHSTAWWIYIGLLLLALSLLCSVCCAAGLAVAAAGRELHVETPIPEDVRYRRLPQIGRIDSV